VYYFYNGGQEEIYMGSADLMQRNLDHRVEVVFPVESPEYIRYLRDQMLEIYLKDNTRARVMRGDGTYVRIQPPSEEKAIDVQRSLMNGSGIRHHKKPKLFS
jgi:polyphosphate kinase